MALLKDKPTYGPQKVSGDDVVSYVKANINDPAMIAKGMSDYGVSLADIGAAGGWGRQPVTDYVANSGNQWLKDQASNWATPNARPAAAPRRPRPEGMPSVKEMRNQRRAEEEAGWGPPTEYFPAAPTAAQATYTGDGGYGDRLAPYLFDPAAGRAKLQGEIDDLTAKLGGIKQGVSPDQDRMYTTYRDTIRDYGMMMQDIDAYIARPDMRAGAVVPTSPGQVNFAAPQGYPVGDQTPSALPPGAVLPTPTRTTLPQPVETTPTAPTAAPPADNLVPRPPALPALPQPTGTITDAYRAPQPRRGLLARR